MLLHKMCSAEQCCLVAGLMFTFKKAKEDFPLLTNDGVDPKQEGAFVSAAKAPHAMEFAMVLISPSV